MLQAIDFWVTQIAIEVKSLLVKYGNSQQVAKQTHKVEYEKLTIVTWIKLKNERKHSTVTWKSIHKADFSVNALAIKIILIYSWRWIGPLAFH